MPLDLEPSLRCRERSSTACSSGAEPKASPWTSSTTPRSRADAARGRYFDAAFLKSAGGSTNPASTPSQSGSSKRDEAFGVLNAGDHEDQRDDGASDEGDREPARQTLRFLVPAKQEHTEWDQQQRPGRREEHVHVTRGRGVRRAAPQDGRATRRYPLIRPINIKRAAWRASRRLERAFRASQAKARPRARP